MKKRFLATMIGALLISTFMINSTFAYTPIESDATTGPAFDITDTQNSEITNTCNDTDCDAASNIEYASAGDLLGTFKITGYCDYNNCSDATSLTASGTTPIADHTISADWSILPKGTKVLIGDSDIVYTVEDSGVSGNVIDIFYASYSEALANGLWSTNIYLAE